MYWLFILFAFPLLGSLVYVVMVYLPNSRIQRRAVRAVSVAARVIDPTRAVREARADLEQTPTAQNQMRLAAALLDNGESEEAAQHYAQALQGPFASDPDLRLGAARAFAACGRCADALPHLQALQQERPEYRPDTVLLLLARCYAGTGQTEQARAAFEQATARFGTYEAHAEYAVWALDTGDTPTAERLQAEIDKLTQRWTSMNRELNAEPMRRLKDAQQRARKRA